MKTIALAGFVVLAALGLGACSRTGGSGAQATGSSAAGTASAIGAAVGAVDAASAVAGSALAFASSAAASSAPARAVHGADGIAWRHAATDADVDAAFAAARTSAKPLFMYWGAEWCPPCNQVKATLFNRQDFIERSRAFVPVYIDGDSPGAQKLGARFHVVGYPTMVLFSPAGVELTRLPGEVDPERYTEVVTLGMNARRPVKAVLADALADPRALGATDWRLLAFYAWGVDEQQVVPKSEVPRLLKRLAAACPPSESETATRLWLQALAAQDKAPSRPVPAVVDRLLALLADDAAARRQFDVLVASPAEIVRAAVERASPPRARLVAAFDALLVRLEADPALSRADRIGAAIARVDLARIDVPEAKEPKARLAAARRARIPAPLLADVRDQAARVDREITDGYERQAVVTAAAYLLGHAGLIEESDALLKANLEKSHSPYYLMTELADNAAQRGDDVQALEWHRLAYEKSTGPATRLQWGARYLGALVDYTPRDEATIEATALALVDAAAAQPNAFYERSARSLARVGAKLRAWNGSGAHAAAVSRIQSRVDAICARIPAADEQHANCLAVTRVRAGKSA